MGKKSKKIWLALLLVAACYPGLAQLENRLQKLSPLLQENIQKQNLVKPRTFLVSVTETVAFEQWVQAQQFPIKMIAAYKAANVFVVETNWADMLQKLASTNLVTFIDEKRLPKEELVVNGFDAGTNKINMLHNEFPLFNGKGSTVSVKENKPDTTDIDFKERYIPTPLSSATVTGHASIMTTMIAGGGNSYYQGKGAAWAAGITSSSFATLLPDANAVYQQYNISVQNHSYGTGIENFYGADAVAYDASTLINPSLVHNFSAGNSGTGTSTTGRYAGIQGYANITGSFKMAKNIITVGATDSFGIVAALSSKGPAYDGRIKPELVAFGEDGSSGAAAIVSGICLVLQQAYKEQHNNMTPPATLIKSLLLNSADDVETPGIDFKSGFGSVNAYKAMKGSLSERFFNRSVINGGTQTFFLPVAAGIKQLKLTLVWDDPVAAANAGSALINDLDMELSLNGQTWQPWVLNHTPHRDSLALLPVRKKDSINNVEQITLDTPVPGIYTVKVIGYKVTTPIQNFSVSWQTDTSNIFKWHNPTAIDNLTAGATNTIRWESSFPDGFGQLEYSLNGTNWQLINTLTDLKKASYKWLVPDTFSIALLRMKVGAQVFVSDTFTISKRMVTAVGLNCPDSFLFYWPKVSGITRYQVFRLVNSYLQPILTTTDTAIIISKSMSPSLHYTVAPVIGNKTGVKSFTFNYSTQGIDCYFKSFFAQLNSSNTVLLDLELGSNYRIKKMDWQKLSGGNFQTLQTVSPVNSLQFSYTDRTLFKGINTYRVKIELENGQIIYSHEESVNFLQDAEYIIFPNPVSQNGLLHMLTKDPDSRTIEIYNMMGVKIFEKKTNDVLTSFAINRLNKGLYFARIVQNNSVKKTLKFVVY
ncbi:MAG: S8 family serine peptidase [Bacteroidota bacterium]